MSCGAQELKRGRLIAFPEQQIQKANEKTGRNFGEFDIPQVYARLGEKDLALEWLGRNYESRTNFTTYMNVDPAYDSMRSDPRFENLARRIKVQ